MKINKKDKGYLAIINCLFYELDIKMNFDCRHLLASCVFYVISRNSKAV